MTEFTVDNVTDFTKRIKHELVEKNWKMADLAREAGIKDGTIRALLGPRPKYHPRADIVYQIGEALDVSFEYLMTGQEPEIQENPLLGKIKSKKPLQEIVELIADLDVQKLQQIKRMLLPLMEAMGPGVTASEEVG